MGSTATAQLGLGLTPFPITATATLPFALALTFLALRTTKARVDAKTFLGESSSATEKASDPKRVKHDPVTVAARTHANFLENVPIALLFSLIAEAQGADKRVLGTMLASLFGFRAAHAVGLAGDGALGNGRLIGFLGSQLTIAGLAGYAAYLSKGYWNL